MTATLWQEENMLLAKKLKIEKLKRQREFIYECLSEQLSDGSPDGDVSFIYIGKVFPEVISYFKDEGFQVDELISDSLIAESRGMHVYRFTISDALCLTDEERKLAEAVICEPRDDKLSSMHKLLSSLGYHQI